ncbi:MAG TPA: class I SAM-dependent methyltransferase, partial [Planctomycetota bacterium]
MRSYDFLTHVESYSQNLRDVLTAARPYPGCEILDAGSGTGNLSLALKAEGCNVVSCDFSPSAIAAHRAKDPQANVVCASLEQPLPFETDQFDAVCCASVLFALTRAGCLSALR